MSGEQFACEQWMTWLQRGAQPLLMLHYCCKQLWEDFELESFGQSIVIRDQHVPRNDGFCWQAVLLLAELMLAIGEHGEQSTDVTILACALHDIKA